VCKLARFLRWLADLICLSDEVTKVEITYGAERPKKQESAPKKQEEPKAKSPTAPQTEYFTQ
jgi:hypothetical protein